MKPGELYSSKVYSWFGSVESGDFWKPTWLAIGKRGYIKWYEFNGGKLNGVARLQAIYDKIVLENISEYKIGERYANSTLDVSKLCPIVIVLRLRVKNLAERVSFAFDSKQVLDEWLTKFVNLLNNTQEKWRVDSYDAYSSHWQEFQHFLSFANFNYTRINDHVCGVSDDVLDKMIQDDEATSSRDQMKPKKLLRGGVTDEWSDEEAHDAADGGPGDMGDTMNTYFAAGWSGVGS